MDSTSIVFLAVAVAAVAGLYLASLRATTIAELEIEKGRLSVVRGGVAPPILGDLRDIARDAAIARATIRITRSSGRAEVALVGVSDGPAQQIRNVIGSVPLARLINAKRK